MPLCWVAGQMTFAIKGLQVSGVTFWPLQLYSEFDLAMMDAVDPRAHQWMECRKPADPSVDGMLYMSVCLQL